MGCQVHFNCKSGKDRTSVLALESHLLAWHVLEKGRVPVYELTKGMCREVEVHARYDKGKAHKPKYQGLNPRDCLEIAKKVVAVGPE